MKTSSPQTIDEYIAAYPTETQELLQLIRRTIRQEIPAAEEGISYAIPVFKLKENVVFFSGNKSHVSIHPAPRQNPAFNEELSHYKGGKGTVQFPLNKPLPLDLIRRMTRFWAEENSQIRAKAQK